MAVPRCPGMNRASWCKFADACLGSADAKVEKDECDEDMTRT